MDYTAPVQKNAGIVMTKSQLANYFVKTLLSLRKVISHPTGQVFRLKDLLSATPSQHHASGILLQPSPNTAAGAVADSHRLPY